MIRRRDISTLAALLLAVSLARFGAAEEKCEGVLPDFRCEREARYEGFVAPLSMPYIFEDPFATTSVSAHYI